ncbi:MAG: pyridoxal phosphate-dependent aminotransferase [Solirubrobacteraceae bacterium]|jgi:alanine-synthesizing transaminase
MSTGGFAQGRAGAGGAQIQQSARLAGVTYDLRGPVLAEALRLEDAGHEIIKLHVGNPAAFGFHAPDAVLQEVVRGLHDAQGYSDSKGLLHARRAVVQHYERRGVADIDVEDVYLGNGVSELIGMALQALLNPGDEALIPAPDYPLWTASTSLAGGIPVHYPCDEAAGWLPDLDRLSDLITPRTRAIVVINPNNPTGAVYPEPLLRQIAQIAREHRLVLMADEIYDQILYDDAEHVPLARVAVDQPVVVFGGLSKTYRLAGFRAGWLVLAGARDHARGYADGLDVLANLRLCANVPGQHAIQPALGGLSDIGALTGPGGRLRRQRDIAHELLTALPGVSCVRPRGAVYAFPRLDPSVYAIDDDERFVLELLRREKLLLMQGSGFNLPTSDHLRIVTLAQVDVLEEAVSRLGRFLEEWART